jgi:wyosine [tRNA(Phe)-imidazoG37] synthetase (radical SAM superfamily)
MSKQEQPASETKDSNATSATAVAAPPKVEAKHDFTAKLRQESLFNGVMDYVEYRKAVQAAEAAGQDAPAYPNIAPYSINLDLTTACNYRCDHCIDWDILNSPIKYQHEQLEESLRQMASRGLRSVILIGGGEPTIYPGFVPTVKLIKELGMQVSVVSNGSRTERLLEIMPLLEKGDWVRLSLDSGIDETFIAMHNPVKKLPLTDICAAIPALREANPDVQVGFSFIIVWAGAEREPGVEIHENIDEIVTATRLAKDSQFNYISLKPFLSRRPNGSEVMAPEDAENLDRTIKKIRELVDEAKTHETDDFKVLESINLKLLEERTWESFTNQPKVCHMQAFRQVLSPLGLYNCPAHRGVEKALITGQTAYADADKVRSTQESTAAILERFDASKNCSEVTCLYNSANWFIEEAIRGERDLSMDDALPDRMDYFL